MGTQRQSTNESGPSLVGSLGCHAGNRDFCPALAALVGPVQNFFLTVHTISIHLSPLPSKLGRHSCWVASLLVCVSDCDGEKNVQSKSKGFVWQMLVDAIAFEDDNKKIAHFPDERSCLLHNRWPLSYPTVKTMTRERRPRRLLLQILICLSLVLCGLYSIQELTIARIQGKRPGWQMRTFSSTVDSGNNLGPSLFPSPDYSTYWRICTICTVLNREKSTGELGILLDLQSASFPVFLVDRQL